MGIAGRRPKPPGQAVTRNRPLHGWVEIVDTPNLDAPELPARRRNGRRWPAYARETWGIWAAMPHAAKWSPSDWQFALDSLELLIRCAAEESLVSAWVELRARQKTMGCTWDSRQSARLRYVPPCPDDGSDAPSVAALDDYRNL